MKSEKLEVYWLEENAFKMVSVMEKGAKITYVWVQEKTKCAGGTKTVTSAIIVIHKEGRVNP